MILVYPKTPEFFPIELATKKRKAPSYDDFHEVSPKQKLVFKGIAKGVSSILSRESENGDKIDAEMVEYFLDGFRDCCIEVFKRGCLEYDPRYEADFSEYVFECY